MQKRRINIALCCGSLIIGCIIYIVFRPDTYISDLFDNIIFIEKLRITFSESNCNFLRFYLPDYLWCFSLSCGLIAILAHKLSDIFICVTVALMCGVVWELLQLLNITSGTYDYLDILMYLLATICVATINLRSFRNEKVN